MDVLWRKGMATVIVLVAVMAAAALTVGVACDGDIDKGGGGDGDDDDGGGFYRGGGLKEAIQDLYAEIVASESVDGRGVGGDSSDARLDDVASAKAKFVSDSLRRMIGNGEGADGGVTVAAQAASAAAEGGGGGGGGVGVVDDSVVERKLRSKQKEVIDALKRYDRTHGADVDERTAKHVNWLMDKCVEIALAKSSADETTAAAKPADPPPAVDVDALQRRFNDLLDRFERSRTSAGTVYCRGVYGHKSQTSPKTRPPPTPQTARPLPTTKPTAQPPPRSVGRFRLSRLSERPRAVAAVHR